jgi:hypothetical protein
VHVEEGLVVAVAVEELVAPPLPVVAAIMRDGRTVSEMAAPQVTLEPPAGAGSGDDDVVMVLADQGAPLPPPTKKHEAAAPVAVETPAAATAPSIEGAEDAPPSSCWSIPGIGIIDLDATELPSNNQEIFEAVVDRVFADPSVLEVEIPEAAASVAATSADAGTSSNTALMSDAIVSEQPVPRQDGGVGGSTPSAASKAAEGVLKSL